MRFCENQSWRLASETKILADQWQVDISSRGAFLTSSGVLAIMNYPGGRQGVDGSAHSTHALWDFLKMNPRYSLRGTP